MPVIAEYGSDGTALLRMTFSPGRFSYRVFSGTSEQISGDELRQAMDAMNPRTAPPGPDEPPAVTSGEPESLADTTASGDTQLPAVEQRPAAPAPCVVPRLHGKTLTNARRAVRRAQCDVGRVILRGARSVRVRRVRSQQPRAGTQLAPRARVTFVLAS